MPGKGVVTTLFKDLHQYPSGPVAVELAVKYLFPRAEVELAIGDGHDHLAAHDMAFQMGVSVVPVGAVVVVDIGVGIERGQLLQPLA